MTPFRQRKHRENHLPQGNGCATGCTPRAPPDQQHCSECHQSPLSFSPSSSQHTPTLAQGRGHGSRGTKCSPPNARKQRATSKSSGHLPGISVPSVIWPVFPKVLTAPLLSPYVTHLESRDWSEQHRCRYIIFGAGRCQYTHFCGKRG